MYLRQWIQDHNNRYIVNTRQAWIERLFARVALLIVKPRANNRDRAKSPGYFRRSATSAKHRNILCACSTIFFISPATYRLRSRLHELGQFDWRVNFRAAIARILRVDASRFLPDQFYCEIFYSCSRMKIFGKSARCSIIID